MSFLARTFTWALLTFWITVVLWAELQTGVTDAPVPNTTSHHMIFLRVLPEVSGCKLGLSQRESRLSHHLSHLSLSLRKRDEKSTFRKSLWVIKRRKCTVINHLTDFNNFAEDLAEAHREGVGFLLEQVAAGLRPFQPSLHDGLSPASPNKTDTIWMLYLNPTNYTASIRDSNIYRGYVKKRHHFLLQLGQQFSSCLALYIIIIIL